MRKNTEICRHSVFQNSRQCGENIDEIYSSSSSIQNRRTMGNFENENQKISGDSADRWRRQIIELLIDMKQHFSLRSR